MDYFDELSSTGQNIMDMVNKAVEMNDYSRLNQDISKQVIALTEEINRYNRENREKLKQHQAQTVDYEVIGHNRPAQSAGRPKQAPKNQFAKKKKGTPFMRVTPQYANSSFKLIFGICGVCIFLPVLLSGLSAAALYSLAYGLGEVITGAVGSTLCYRMFKNGRVERRIIDRFYTYARLVGDAEYITIADLASLSGESEATVIKNLETMKAKGLLPYAELDAERTTLMLTDNVYKQYVQATGKREEQNAKKKKESAREAEIDSMNVSKEVKDILKNGQTYVDQIQKYNDQIPDEEMTEKLDRLKLIVDRIFAQVRKSPKSAGDLSKFMNYYLPTTEKLITAYIDLDKQPDISKNVVETKKEINASMDTIINAFNNLFDSMFEEVAWDISSDISAMKTMMAQDGLSNDHPNNVKATH